MNILITGGAGFIGGRLAKYFSLKAESVTLATRNAGKAKDWCNFANVLEVDWSRPEDLKRVVRNIDVVIHAAGMNAVDSQNNPVAAEAFNGFVTANLAREAKKSGVTKFIYLSTAHVYSSQLDGVILESTPAENMHPYATSHLSGEMGIIGLNDDYFKTITLRLSNVFGIPSNLNEQCWMLLVNGLCKQAIEESRLILKTNGMQYRDFIGIEQVVETIYKISIIPNGNIKSSVYNLGSGNSLRVIEIAETIQKICTKKLGFTPAIFKKDGGTIVNANKLYYSNERLRKITDIESKNIETEIGKLLLYCLDNFNR